MPSDAEVSAARAKLAAMRQSLAGLKQHQASGALIVAGFVIPLGHMLTLVSSCFIIVACLRIHTKRERETDIHIYIYIDGLKLRMLVWTPVPTRAKLKICVSPAFQNLECAPTPSMKLFGNQQLECSMDICFFQAEIHIYIYILDHPSHHKKGNLPHNFHSFINFSGYLEVLGI